MTSPCNEIWHMIYLWFFTLCPLCIYPYVYIYAQNSSTPYTYNNCQKLSVYCMPTTHSMYNFLPSSTAWNLVLPHKTQKHYSFSSGIPAMQVCLIYVTCSGTSHNSCTVFTAPHTGKSLLFVVLLVTLQDFLHMLHFSFLDPHDLF